MHVCVLILNSPFTLNEDSVSTQSTMQTWAPFFDTQASPQSRFKPRSLNSNDTKSRDVTQKESWTGVSDVVLNQGETPLFA